MKVFLRYIRKKMLEKKGRLFLLVFSIMLTCGLMIASMGLIDTILDSFTAPMKEAAAGKDIAITSSTNDIFIKESDVNTKGIKNLEGEIDLTGLIDEEDEILYTSLKGMKEYKGEMIKGSLDNKDKSECIISKRIADERNLEIGDTLTIRISGENKNFKITGFAATNGIFYNDKKNSFTVVVPYEYLNKLIGANDSYTTILAEYEKDNLSSKAQKDELKKLNDNNSKAFAANLIDDNYGDVSSMQVLLYVMLGVVCVVSILIIRGVFKLIITERMQTIGTFMSQGATKKKVRNMLLLESFLYGCIGSVFGSGLGVGLLFIINRLISPNAEYGIYNPFSINPIHIAIGCAFAIILSVFSSWSAIRKIKKLQVKEVILNRVENHEKTGFITRIITGFLSKIFKGNTTAFLAINNIKSSKLLRNNIKLLTVSLAAVLSVVSVSKSMVKVVTGAYEDMDYDYDIENILDSASAKTTTESILEELVNDKNVDKKSINTQYVTMGEVEKTPVIAYGVDPEAHKNWLDGYMGYSKKPLADDYEKFSKSNDDVMVLGKSIAKKLDKKVGDFVTLSINQKDVKFKIAAIADYKLFNGGTVCLIKSEKLKNYYGIREAGTITYKTNGNTVALDKKYKKLAKKYGATIMSKNEEMDINNKQNAQMMMMFSIFAYIALGLAAIGIFNNITICFMQRSKEFAVMSSIGMNKKMRRKLIITENLICAIWSMILAIPAGIICNIGMEALLKALDIPLPIYFNLLAIPLYGAIIAGIVMIASLSALKKSNKLNLVAELKYE